MRPRDAEWVPPVSRETEGGGASAAWAKWVGAQSSDGGEGVRDEDNEQNVRVAT